MGCADWKRNRKRQSRLGRYRVVWRLGPDRLGPAFTTTTPQAKSLPEESHAIAPELSWAGEGMRVVLGYAAGALMGPFGAVLVSVFGRD